MLLNTRWSCCTRTLNCEGHYYRGYLGSFTEPPEAEVFEFNHIKVNGTDIDVWELMGEEQLSEVEALCIQDLRERTEYQYEEHMERVQEMRAEMRRDEE